MVAEASHCEREVVRSGTSVVLDAGMNTVFVEDHGGLFPRQHACDRSAYRLRHGERGGEAISGTGADAIDVPGIETIALSHVARLVIGK